MHVSREVSFRALHSHRGMLCEPKHPHEWRVTLTLEGVPNSEGFVVDFRAVKRIFLRVVAAELEGRDLDSIFEYPTSENIARWVWERMEPFFPLHSVEVREKPHSSAVYFGPCVG